MENTSKYNLTPEIKRNEDVHQFILEETSHFPPKHTISFRARAVADENSCECLYCGTIVSRPEKDFCSKKCHGAYRKENPEEEALEEALEKVPNLSLYNPDDFPNGTAEPDDPKQFINVWNRIKSLDDSFLAENVTNFNPRHSGNIKNAILCYLARIVTWNKEVTDYFDQAIRCFQYPLKNKTENLEWFTMLYGDHYAKVKLGKKSERVSGENNPGYNHGGTLSPFSEKFVGGDVKQETIEKAHQSREENNGYSVRLSYWTERYGEEKGKELFYDRQNTFSLEKVQERYGEEEGYRIWKERQDNWQETMNNLPEEKRIEIDAKKGFWHYYNPKTDEMNPDSEINEQDTILYVFEYQPREYDETFIKVGVTSKYLSQRFPLKCIKDKLIIHHSDRFTNFQIERDVKKHIVNNDLFITMESEEHRFDGWTECVSADYKEEILGVANEAIRRNTEKV